MDHRKLAQVMVRAAVVSRLAFPRGRFEGLEANVIQVALSLWLRPGQTVRALSGELALDYTTVSHGLADLAAGEFVQARVVPHDRRSRELRLTPAGDALVSRVLDSRLAFLGDGRGDGDLGPS